MSCQGCLPIDCLYDLDDVDLYDIQGDPFLFVLECPPGYTCNPDPGGGTVSQQCCDQTLTASYPPNVTVAQFNSIVSGLVAQCAARQPFCGETPPPTDHNQPSQTFYWNRPCNSTVYCPSDRAPFTYRVQAGLVYDTTQAGADAAACVLARKLAVSHRVCLRDTMPTQFCEGSAFSQKISATGSFVGFQGQPNHWSVLSGAMPDGLTISDGYTTNPFVTISGTPTTPGAFTFTVQIVTPTGDSQTKTYTICIVGQTSNPIGSDSTHLPDAAPLMPYSVTLEAPTCAITPLSWQLNPGDSLPAGLSLDETTGVISGTPAMAGTYTFTIILQTEAT